MFLASAAAEQDDRRTVQTTHSSRQWKTREVPLAFQRFEANPRSTSDVALAHPMHFGRSLNRDINRRLE